MIAITNTHKTLQILTSITWPILCFYLGGAVSYAILLALQLFGISVDIDTILSRIVFTSISVVAALSILLFAPKIAGIKTLRPQSLAFTSFRRKHMFTIVAILLLLLLLSQISDAVVQMLHIAYDDSSNAPSFASINLNELVGNIFIAGVLTALLEEVLYRGYMYGNLKSVSNSFIASMITSIVFAIMHFDIAFLPFLVVFSLTLCALREKTGSIIPGLIVHMLFNGLVITFAYIGLF